MSIRLSLMLLSSFLSTKRVLSKQCEVAVEFFFACIHGISQRTLRLLAQKGHANVCTPGWNIFDIRA